MNKKTQVGRRCDYCGVWTKTPVGIIYTPAIPKTRVTASGSIFKQRNLSVQKTMYVCPNCKDYYRKALHDQADQNEPIIVAG